MHVIPDLSRGGTLIEYVHPQYDIAMSHNNVSICEVIQKKFSVTLVFGKRSMFNFLTIV